WAVLLISTIIILGRVVGIIHYTDQFSQILYLRKLLIISSVTLVIQVFWGHRLPLIPGPSAVLLIGILACKSFPVSVIYTSIMAGGILLVILSMSGLLKYVNRFFTANVISVVLVLIAFTMTPAIIDLIIDEKGGVNPSYNMLFAIVMIFIMFIFHRILKGIWKSTIVIWSIVLGSFAYFFILYVKQAALPYEGPWLDSFLYNLNTSLSFHPGVMISFFFCFIALLINDLGSIQSVNEILEVRDRQGRVKRGVAVTGLANLFAGFMGVIGPVNFSISPGIILSTGCASRFTLIPAVAIMFILAFLPRVTGAMGNIPPVVIGAVLAYLMAIQVASGLMVAFKDAEGKEFKMENGMVIGISVFLGTIVTFLPAVVTDNISPVLRPVLANGFVAGVTSAILMEQILIKKGTKVGTQG
ncbi:MAG: solute carrier family 23 protein, partial [Desulfobacteraceae bacterium]